MDALRFSGFDKRSQLLMIGSEFSRAGIWQRKDESAFKGALERATGLIDLAIQDTKWNDERMQLELLRDEVDAFYHGRRVDDVGILYRAL